MADYKYTPHVRRHYPTSSRSYPETHPDKPAPVPQADYETPRCVGKYERASLERSDLNGVAEHIARGDHGGTVYSGAKSNIIEEARYHSEQRVGWAPPRGGKR
ncbi:hypothetical protein ACVWXP_006435 [Bradyrhizobium sp. USDA 4463]